MKKAAKLELLLGLYVTCLVLANLLGNKVTSLFGVRASVGIFVFPLLFLITDMVEEVYGKEKAKHFVFTGLAALVFTFLVLVLAIHVPPNPAWGYQAAYEEVLGQSQRIILASFVAFLLSQLSDVWSFNLLKEKTHGKWLWLRNNVSTMTSQLVDTTVFMFLAFYLLTPKFTAGFVISLIIPYWLLKVVFAAVDTPFVYLGVRWLKR